MHVKDGIIDYENKGEVIDPKTQSIKNRTVTLRKTDGTLTVSDKLGKTIHYKDQFKLLIKQSSDEIGIKNTKTGRKERFVRKDSPKYKKLISEQDNNLDKSNQEEGDEGLPQTSILNDGGKTVDEELTDSDESFYPEY